MSKKLQNSLLAAIASVCVIAFCFWVEKHVTSFVTWYVQNLPQNREQYCTWRNGCPSDKCYSGPLTTCGHDYSGGGGCPLVFIKNPECFWKSPLKYQYHEITRADANICLERFKQKIAQKYPFAAAYQEKEDTIRYYRNTANYTTACRYGKTWGDEKDIYGDFGYCYDFHLSAPNEVQEHTTVKVHALTCEIFWDDLPSKSIYRFPYPDTPQIKTNYSFQELKSCAENYLQQHQTDPEYASFVPDELFYLAYSSGNTGNQRLAKAIEHPKYVAVKRHLPVIGDLKNFYIDHQKDYYTYEFYFKDKQNNRTLNLEIGAATCAVYDASKFYREHMKRKNK